MPKIPQSSLFTPEERALLRRADDLRADERPADIRQLRVLLRRHRNTFRDRSRRQQREQSGKQQPRARNRSTSHANTATKAEAFAAALARVELKVQGPAKPMGGVPAPGARKRAAGPADGSNPARAPGKRRRKPVPASGGRAKTGGTAPSAAHRKAKHGVIKALTRRNQAKRDSRI